MRGGQKEPLYRKVNTRTHHVDHGMNGGEARWARNTKATKANESMRGSMHPGHRHGLDYTPLYRFLLSRLGRDWDEVCSEALPRIADRDALYHMVARNPDEERDFVRLGENSYWSGLRVNAANLLEKVAPNLTAEAIEPGCTCCTHTFNGMVIAFGKEQLDLAWKYVPVSER
ncbi:MAG: hypothetical protein V4586_03070 [Pseudomonadota bacterium]